MRNGLTVERLSFDVLVLGTGAAGLRAALEARRRGLRVCALSKGKPGKATCTVFSGGVMAGTPLAASRESHLERTLMAGRGLNDVELVRVLVEEAPMRLRELVQWGMKGEFQEGYLYAQGRPPVWGEEITRCLLGMNMALGTQFLGEFAVCDMKVSDGCTAVVAWEGKSGRFVEITSRAAVLAMGGAGALFLRSDNPRGIVGEGYVLALDAGAVLQDMEFVQFYPLGLAESGLPPFLIPPRLADRGKLVNSRGEDIMEKYGITERPAAERARDRLSRALFTEIHRNGETVLLDLRGLSPREWRIDPFSASTVGLLGDRYGASRRPVRVAPMAHHIMGGVMIDPQGATSVPGLFAAGEVAGGLHGANRMGGNALSETLVFGARAGEGAADWVEGSEFSDCKAAREHLHRNSGGSGRRLRGASKVDHHRRLRQIMWEYGGILRSADGLAQALSVVGELEQDNRGCREAATDERLLQSLRLRMALRAARLVLEAARKRRESRGAHFREDFPEQDDPAWTGHLQVHLDSQGEIQWQFKPLPRYETCDSRGTND